ncbi:glycosyltransferase family 2 protein [Oceanobacillus manasiensis]|uniref:glycosyltransferase family 2 protein n=1 Tax=Oceanobacillus manasiensis TaxID=586413 RepID=UPI000693D8D4|nr:glycosyltransferase family A protein [Oceanobacillus manasiensis]
MRDKANNNETQEISNYYETELRELDERVKRINKENELLKRELIQARHDFNQVNALTSIRSVKRFIRSTIAYILGRRDRRQLYSKAYKDKKAKNMMKNFSYYLYSLGFEEKVITELMFIYSTSKNRYVKKEAAWELLLWFANKHTVIGAAQALNFVQSAREKEKDNTRLRKINILEIEILLRLDRQEDAQWFLYSSIQRGDHADQYLTAANLEKKLDDRVEWINKCLKSYNLMGISLSTSEKPTDYDRLQTISGNKTKGENYPLVSVIIPVFNAEDTISTTLDSLLAQTWENVEIIVVDDKSTDQTISVVEKYIQTCKNITLLQNPVNSGPYVSRNRGLYHATGVFVTVNDADDWSHAQKIQLQAKHLLANDKVVANTSQQARVYEDITFTRRGVAGGYIFSNMSSLMFRRQVVMEKIGFWDQVRFAGDSEFINRLKYAFGNGSMVNLETGPLSFVRQTTNSLTGSNKFGYNGHLKGARKEYAQAFRHYHKKANTLYFPYAQQERLFPVPYAMRVGEQRNKTQRYDIVIASDYRYPDKRMKEITEEIKQLADHGYNVALLQLDVFDFSMPKQVNYSIRALMEEKDISMLVFGEQVNCELILVRTAEVLLEKQSFIPDIRAKTVSFIIDQSFFEKVRVQKNPVNSMRKCSQQAFTHFGRRGNWFPKTNKERQVFKKNYPAVLKYIKLSKKNWFLTEKDDSFIPQLKDLVVQQKSDKGVVKSEKY